MGNNAMGQIEWKNELDNLLGGYFSDFTIEEGVEQMVFVSRVNKLEHQLYLQTLAHAIDALQHGDGDDILQIIDRNNLYVRNIQDGINLLESIHREYLRQYND